jgi:hypothetical protein
MIFVVSALRLQCLLAEQQTSTYLSFVHFVQMKDRHHAEQCMEIQTHHVHRLRHVPGSGNNTAYTTDPRNVKAKFLVIPTHQANLTVHAHQLFRVQEA